MSHPNDMTTWETIACRRGCRDHQVRETHIELGGPTLYRDHAPIPDRLKRCFDMWVWDTEAHPVDGGAYCPAHDAVSETILSHGVWEPHETIALLDVFGHTSGQTSFLDLGAQLGWFSLLAASYGIHAIAIDAEGANLSLLRQSVLANDWPHRVECIPMRITSDMQPWTEIEETSLHFCAAKVDIEGAERAAFDHILEPLMRAGRIDHVLMEVTPVFHSGYGDLVASIIDLGYRAFRFPEKSIPPPTFAGIDDLVPFDLSGPDLVDEVNSWHQENLWFTIDR